MRSRLVADPAPVQLVLRRVGWLWAVANVGFGRIITHASTYSTTAHARVMVVPVALGQRGLNFVADLD